MRDLAVVSRQFATLVDSGMPMLRALGTLEEQTENEEIASSYRAAGRCLEVGVQTRLEGLPDELPEAPHEAQLPSGRNVGARIVRREHADELSALVHQRSLRVGYRLRGDDAVRRVSFGPRRLHG